ncbi:MAG: hypothetical protein H6656_17790 [Ardenticatenaceae bacterium]|nr:hypothetical protein [Ardenticatenaceae bacterium]
MDISKNVDSLSHPQLSKIFALPLDEQKSIYRIILNEIEPSVLSPLTILYHTSQHPEFNLHFNLPEIRFETRLERLNEAVKIYYPHQSNEATDLRFLALSLHLFGGKFTIASHLTTTPEALSKYPYTSHDDERMRLYRPTIRSTEGVVSNLENDPQFSQEFWNRIGMITRCNLMRIVHKENETDYQPFIKQVQTILEYVLSSYKQESLSSDKLDVIIGSFAYALKVFTEVNDKSLGNSVLGRHAARTIIEILIILKILIEKGERETRHLGRV